MTSTIYKRYSPKTRSVGMGKLNRNVTLTLEAILELEKEALAAGESVNQWLRKSIYMRAKSVALKAAIVAQDRHVVCSLLAGVMILGIQVRAWVTGDVPEFRRTRIVRTVRKPEEA